MIDISLMRNNIIFFAGTMLIACVVYVLISLVSIIYNRISFKTTFKEWLYERKYFLLLYLYFFLAMIYMMFFMFFGFLGMFLGILILTAAAGILVNINLKRNIIFYIEEATAYNCQCGKNISKIIKIKTSGDEKLLYYICRGCQKKYSEKELENNSDSDIPGR